MKVLEKLKMNIPVRFKNPAFWIGLAAAIFTAMNVSPEMFTSWEMVVNEFIALINNPFRLGCVVVAIVGVFVDPTTPGIGDSVRALGYTKPGKE